MPDDDLDLETDPLDQADLDTDYRLDLIAVTETSTAYEDEFTSQTDRMPARSRDRSWLPIVVIIWDSSLDKRRCRVCASASLEVRPLGMSFSGGMRPGHAHPRCRCVSVIVVLAIPYTPAETT